MKLIKYIDLVGLYCALSIALSLVYFTGLVTEWGEWYSNDIRYRLQTEALLKGNLALSERPGGVTFDLTWSGGGAQQVWGLGVPFWRLPFEGMAKLLGYQGFPDRITLGIAIFLVSFLGFKILVRGGPKEPAIKKNELIFSIGGLILLFIFPNFILLLSGRMAIYEEALAYVYLYGIAEALILLWFIRKPQLKRWLILSAMAGLGAFIRPTLLFYGAASMLVGTLLLFCNRPHPAQDAAPKSFLIRLGLPGYSWLWGPFFFLLGGGLLFLTNLKRFDDGFEFGHKLNLQSENLLDSMYATRFDYPYQNEPILSASEELFGMMFRNKNFSKNGFNNNNLFSGQSDTFRWRECYLPSYSFFTFFLLIGGCISSLYCLIFNRIKKQRSVLFHNQREFGYCVLWSLLATISLFYFYLWTPVVSSRYMLDFAPAFAILIFVLYKFVSNLFNNLRKFLFILIPFFIIWITNDFLHFSYKIIHNGYDRNLSVNIEMIKNSFSLYLLQKEEDFSFDGLGWDKKTGEAGVLSVIFVHDAKFLGLELEPNQSVIDEMAKKGATNFPKPDPEVIRAKIGLEYLERESITKTDDGWEVRFKGPQRKVYQSGYQVAFLAMVAKENLSYTNTPWLLKSVRWNETDPPKTINREKDTPTPLPNTP